MGNSESSNPIRNMDKRTARREYKEDFMRGIENYKSKLLLQRGKPGQDTSKLDSWNDGDMKVFVRKRPIFNHEVANGEFDVVTCLNNHIIVHDARMHIDMKKQLLHHHEFEFDYVFSDQMANSSVYQKSARPLVEIACKGGFATAMVYGQTGSGKTFTMTSIYSQAAEDIFSTLHAEVERFSRQPTVSVSFIEVAGDNVSDLLNGFMPTQLRTASDGTVHAFPVTEPTVGSLEDLMAVIQHGLNIRTTAATGVHDASSRSHAILKIYIQRYDLKERNEMVEGTLTLVDLAGSEHRIDSMYHGKERRKETSQINASLMALKECIRARSEGGTSGQHVYRKSKLTLALKASFALPCARTVVIATVSPASKDTEHSLNTLRHACIMHGQSDVNQVNKDETRFTTGGVTTVEHIGEINVASIARRNKQNKKLHGEIENIKTSNGNQLDNKVARAANQEVELTDKQKRKMRRMAEAKSFGALEPRLRELIKAHREQLGCEQMQLLRFQRSHVGGVVDDDAGEVAEDLQQFHASMQAARPALAHDHLEESEGDASEDDRSPPPPALAKTYDDDFEPATPRPLSARTGANATAAASSSRTAGHIIETSLTSRADSSAVSMSQIYDCVFLVQDTVHPSALAKQLEALCRLHGYDSFDIERFFAVKTLRLPSATAPAPAAPAANRAITPVSTRRQSSGTAAPATTVGRTPTKMQVQLITQSQQSTAPRSASRARAGVREESTVAAPLSARAGSAGSAHSTGMESTRSAGARQSKSPHRRPAAAHPSVSSASAAAAAAAAERAQSHAEEEMTWAKQQLEREAQQRKARQEAARQLREEREESNRQKSDQLKAKVRSVAPAAPTEADLPIEVQAAKEIAEIGRLQLLLDGDGAAAVENRMSTAMKYGLKKQIALLRAAVLKKERAKNKPVEQYTLGGGEEGSEPSVAKPQHTRVQPQRAEAAPAPVQRPTSATAPAPALAQPVVDFSKLYEEDRWQEAAANEQQQPHEDYAVSALGRPLSKKLAQKVAQRGHPSFDPMYEQEAELPSRSTAVRGSVIDYSNDYGAAAVVSRRGRY